MISLSEIFCETEEKRKVAKILHVKRYSLPGIKVKEHPLYNGTIACPAVNAFDRACRPIMQLPA